MIFVIVYLILVVFMSLIWIAYRYLNNPSVVDVGWAIALIIAGLTYLFSKPISPLSWMAGALLTLWGLRLGGYLWFTRIRHGHLDKRYELLSNRWNISKPLGFFINFQLQGIIIWVLALPFYFIAQKQGELTGYSLVVSAIICLALAGESLADWQLYSFKKNPDTKVCQKGLWNYSRHPNYFFDWLCWLGFALLALSDPAILALLAPLSLYYVMNHITGPLTEKNSIRSKGQAYIQYQQTTHAFFPWKNKKQD